MALPALWRSVFGPPPRAHVQPDSENRVSFLAGWYWYERTGRWTKGRLACLAIQVPKGGLADTLRITGIAFWPRPGDEQVIDVFSGWRRLGQLLWNSDHGGSINSISLPLALRRRKVITFQLWIREPIVPAFIGLGDDARELGMLLQDARIVSPLVRDVEAQPLLIKTDSDDSAVLWNGWSVPEPTGCWSVGYHARLRWISPRDLPSNAHLVLCGFCFAPLGTIAGSISINGRYAGDLGRLGVGSLSSIAVPLQLPAGQREVNIEINFLNPQSPLNTAISDDPRKIGLFLQSVHIESGAGFGNANG
jgi:hypothetical protein